MIRGTFRDLLATPGCHVVPAVYDALSARIVERIGFQAVGQLTMTEMVDHLRGMAGACRFRSWPTPFETHFALVGLGEYEALERRYAE